MSGRSRRVTIEEAEKFDLPVLILVVKASVTGDKQEWRKFVARPRNGGVELCLRLAGDPGERNAPTLRPRDFFPASTIRDLKRKGVQNLISVPGTERVPLDQALRAFMKIARLPR